MEEDLEFDNILEFLHGYYNPCKVKFKVNEILYKNVKTGKLDKISLSDINNCFWQYRTKGWCLRICSKSGHIYRFDGFDEKNYSKLYDFLKKHYTIELQKRDMSYKGWNYGSVQFVGDSMDFQVDDKPSFELPLQDVSNVTHTKNELVMEFHQNDDVEICLTEMRLYVPNSEEGDEVLIDRLYSKIVKKANIIEASGSAIVEFKDLQCVQPRGRYELKLYQTFIHMHGKSYDFKIPMNTIQKFFLLPHPDGRQIFFLISLDPPIKQGQTRYQFVILSFDQEIETTISFNASDEDFAAKFGNKLSKTSTGPEYELVALTCKTFADQKVTGPGSFKSASLEGSCCINAGYKATTGLLYPLERFLIFLPRPGISIRINEITSVQFNRGDPVMKTFDIEVETTHSVVYLFSSISKAEYDKLYAYIKEKKIPIKNTGETNASKLNEMWEGSSDESVFDAYKEKVVAEGLGRTAARNMDRGRKNRDGGDNDFSSSDEDDADFVPGAEPEDLDSQDDRSTDSDEDKSLSPSNPKEGKKRRKHSDGESEEPSSSPVAQKKTSAVKRESIASTSKTKRVTKKTKVKKDPNAPKRPMSAYFLWFNEKREEIKKSLKPDTVLTEVAKAAGARWNALDASVKKPYNDRLEILKETYKKEMEVYKRKLASGELVLPGQPEKKPRKDPSAAKAANVASGAANIKSNEFVDDSSASLSD